MNDPNCDFITIRQRGGEVDLSMELFRPLVDRERKRLNRALRRDQKRSKRGDLNLVEWFQILHHYKWLCAYCKDRLHESIDHITPICEGGLTDRFNCVPCCMQCQNERAHHTTGSINARLKLATLFDSNK